MSEPRKAVAVAVALGLYREAWLAACRHRLEHDSHDLTQCLGHERLRRRHVQLAKRVGKHQARTRVPDMACVFEAQLKQINKKTADTQGDRVTNAMQERARVDVRSSCAGGRG